MQVHNSAYRSVITCAQTVYHTEGIGAFYISYPTTLLMSIPFTAVQFSIYEQTLQLINPKHTYDPLSHVAAGGLAGAVAAAVTTPLDVAKTLLQTRGTSEDKDIRKARGISDAVRLIWRKDGLRGFARGLTPRVLTFVPSNALCWMSYEFFSELLSLYVVFRVLTLAPLLSRNGLATAGWRPSPTADNPRLTSSCLTHVRPPLCTLICCRASYLYNQSSLVHCGSLLFTIEFAGARSFGNKGILDFSGHQFQQFGWMEV